MPSAYAHRGMINICFIITINLWWAEPQRHTVVVCVCMCVILFCWFLNVHQKLSTEIAKQAQRDILLLLILLDFKFMDVFQRYMHETLTLTTVASNIKLGEDWAGHSRLHVLFNMTVRPVQKYSENETAKATQTNQLFIAHTQVPRPNLAPWPGTRPDCLLATALVYTNRSLAALLPVSIVTLLACSCKLLHCSVPGFGDCSCCTCTWSACMCW